MSKYITDAQLRRMSYNDLGKAVTSGELTVKRLQSYYTGARRTAMSRQRTIETRTHGEFGELQKESFTKLRNLRNTSDLLHEIADVNKFLEAKRSTITGLKEVRESVMTRAEQMGFDVDYGNYADYIRFMNWFQNSEFAKYYDSDSEEVMEVFNMAQQATKQDWEQAMLEFNLNYGKSR